jgi:hypothetical protein
MGENALHFGSVEVYKRTIHPCCSNCHYDHIGTLKHLRWRNAQEIDILPSTSSEQGRTKSNASGRFTGIEFYQHPSVVDRRKSKITIQIQTTEYLWS